MDTSSEHSIELINRLEGCKFHLNQVRLQEERMLRERTALMVEAREAGLTYQAIGDALGVTKAYIHQQIKLLAPSEEPTDG